MEFSPDNHGICQDENGVMYFGNTGEILTFDGNQWRSILVVPQRVTHSLLTSKNGTIYVGSQGDFGRLIADSIGAYHYTSLVDSTIRVDHPFMEVWNILEVNNAIYFHSEEQIFRLENGEVTLLPMPSSVHTVFNVDDQLVVRMRDHGLLVWKGDKWNKVDGSELFELYGVFGIVNTKNQNVKLVISQEIGLFKWYVDKNVMDPYPTDNDEDLINHRLFGAKRISEKRISLLTKTKGLLFINEKGEEVGGIDKRMGLASNYIRNQFIDIDGNLWLTTANGITLVNLNARLSYFGELQGLHGGVKSVIETTINGKNLLFSGTNEGLYVLSPNDKSSFRIFKKIEAINYAVWDLAIHNNNLFVGTGEGLYTINLNKRPYVVENILRRNSNSLLIDTTNNHLISAGGKGVYIFDLKTLQLIHTFEESLATVTGIQMNTKGDTTEYWMALHGQGVLKINYDSSFSSEFFSGTNYGLPEDHILVPHRLNNEIVFGTTLGLLDVDETNVDGEVYTFFMPDSIGDSIIQAPILYLLEDSDKIWYCIDNNVGVYDKSEKDFTNRPFWGIKKGRVNKLYSSNDQDYLWIGASDGLIRFDIHGDIPYKKNFHALIRSVHTTNEQLTFGGIKHKDLNPIEVDYDKNFIRFNFSAPYYEDHQPIEFSFWLEGYEKGWSEWKEKNEKDFTNLPEGNYTFHVKARNIYKQEAEEAHIDFTIATPWYRTTMAYIGYILLFFLVVYLAIKISSMQLKAQNKRLETAVQERTKEIEEKNSRLENQKSEILHQKTEIEDSINYAQRIQKAILPIKEEMKQYLTDSFILFWPKDVVSGDFYWFHQRGDESVIVCADCTGHGVPGAFMSMIGVDKLNVCVGEKGITSPDKILSFLNTGIKTSLRQDESKKATRDGMDAAIITINHKNKTIKYAGAHRSLWIIGENGELQEIKATKVAVGGFTSIDQVYELHEIKVKEKLQLYMSSDGYADQFGGERNKKFKIKAMKNIFTENYSIPMVEQQQILEDRMIEWFEGYEQIDDICVIGVTVKPD
jgi:serine phosphatase RsbU (regulator of sigma subunit)